MRRPSVRGYLLSILLFAALVARADDGEVAQLIDALNSQSYTVHPLASDPLKDEEMRARANGLGFAFGFRYDLWTVWTVFKAAGMGEAQQMHTRCIHRREGPCRIPRLWTG